MALATSATSKATAPCAERAKPVTQGPDALAIWTGPIRKSLLRFANVPERTFVNSMTSECSPPILLKN
jgi:hypothetical protein